MRVFQEAWLYYTHMRNTQNTHTKWINRKLCHVDIHAQDLESLYKRQASWAQDLEYEQKKERYSIKTERPREQGMD